ncbi:hypothetical protein JCM1840_004518 [Sporobolomyces johnsonii]
MLSEDPDKLEPSAEQLPVPPVSALAAHLDRFRYASSSPSSHPTPPRLVQPSPQRSVSGTQPPSTSSRNTPERKPQARRRSAATPPRPDGSSRHFKRPADETSLEREDGTLEVKMEGESETPKTKKKKRPARPYADPSTYAELGADPLTDYLRCGLDLLLCGINPGVKSAQLGLHYASPTNHFWKALAGSGLTDRLLDPSEGPLLPKLYGIGSTNLVPRPSAEMSELSNDEMKACVPALLRKIAAHKPKMVAFVGMKICEVVLRHLHNLPAPSASCTPAAPPTTSDPDSPRKKRQPPASPTKRKKAMPKVTIGLQPVTLSFPPEQDGEAREKLYFWCLPSTSARVVQYQLVDKIKIFGLLKADVSRLASTPPIPLELADETVDYPVEMLFAPDQPAPGPTWTVTLLEPAAVKAEVKAEEDVGVDSKAGESSKGVVKLEEGVRDDCGERKWPKVEPGD